MPLTDTERRAKYREYHHAALARMTPAEREAFREKIRQHSREWYRQNRAKHLARTKAYYRSDPARKAAWAKAWSAKNPEKRAAIAVKYRKTHPDKCRARNRDWYRRNKTIRGAKVSAMRKAWPEWRRARQRAQQKAFYRKRPEVFFANALKRKVIKLAVTVNAAGIAAWVRDVRRRPFVSCYYCQTPLLGISVHFEHVIPLSKGGAHCLSNLAISCSHCNLSKNNRLPSAFAVKGQLFLSL